MYDEFLDECRQPLRLLDNGATSPAAALRARTAVMDAYRRCPGLDPQLPVQLMPADWPRADARDLFVRAYDGLAPLAELRVRQIIARFDPALAALARSQLSTEFLT